MNRDHGETPLRVPRWLLPGAVGAAIAVLALIAVVQEVP